MNVLPASATGVGFAGDAVVIGVESAAVAGLSAADGCDSGAACVGAVVVVGFVAPARLISRRHARVAVDRAIGGDAGIALAVAVPTSTIAAATANPSSKAARRSSPRAWELPRSRRAKPR